MLTVLCAPKESMPEHTSTIADRLNRLFTTVRRPDGSRWTDRTVAEALTSAGYKVSHTHIWALRTGEATNPPIGTLRALADLFGVAVAYFVDDETAARIDPQLELAGRLQDAGVRQLALRAAEMTPEAVNAVLAILDQVAALERHSRGR
ncbi:MAG TPA: XRE family transcriptional regulator [Micromonosporaceae bacterium]